MFFAIAADAKMRTGYLYLNVAAIMGYSLFLVYGFVVSLANIDVGGVFFVTYPLYLQCIFWSRFAQVFIWENPFACSSVGHLSWPPERAHRAAIERQTTHTPLEASDVRIVSSPPPAATTDANLP